MFISRFICVVCINVGFKKNDVFGGKQLLVLPSWLHPVCDVAPTLVS